ncbi:MAG: AraC family transcriptional regulator [Lachnospiraceae bacterium]
MKKREYMRNIAELNFSNYKFILHYAEILDHEIPEFPHRHDLHQIYYVLEGNINIMVEDQMLAVGQEQAVFLVKDIKHHVYFEPDKPKRYLGLIFDIMPYQHDAFCGPDGPLEYKDLTLAMEIFTSGGYYVSTPYSEKEIVLNIEQELVERRLGWNTQAVMLCYQFFIKSLRHISQAPVTDRQFSGKENLAMNVSKYIHSNYWEDISVESVAEAVGVSTRHINRAYKTVFGTTFMKNTNILRIAYAKYYLCNTDASIEEIAEMVGFASPRVLYKLFIQYEGISLSQYRKEHRKIS